MPLYNTYILLLLLFIGLHAYFVIKYKCFNFIFSFEKKKIFFNAQIERNWTEI